MEKRNKEFFEKRKQVTLQQAWDIVSEHISKTSTGAWTHFVSTVYDDEHWGYVVLHDGDGIKAVSTKKYK